MCEARNSSLRSPRHFTGRPSSEEFLAALAAPLHRAAELARSMADQCVLGREAGLHAEAAADVAVHHAEVLRLAAERRREQVARGGGRLVLRVQHAAAVFDDADGTARL